MSNYKDFLVDFEKSILSNKRAIEEVELIAVSKRKAEEDILSVINLGHRNFGENQIQEVIKKWPNLKNQFHDIKVHFIGSIQSKKIHQTFFIQVNTGSEIQKSGVSLDQVEALIQKCKDYDIKIGGLMCLPPESEAPDKHFAILQSLAKNNHIKYLSMGMTNDYDTALKYGATHIRVGTAIFGSRD